MQQWWLHCRVCSLVLLMTACSHAGGAAGTIAPLVTSAAAAKAGKSALADTPPASAIAADPTAVRLDSGLPLPLHMPRCNLTPRYSIVHESCICQVASNDDGRVCSTAAVCPPLLLIVPRTYLRSSRATHACFFHTSHLASGLSLP